MSYKKGWKHEKFKIKLQFRSKSTARNQITEYRVEMYFDLWVFRIFITYGMK